MGLTKQYRRYVPLASFGVIGSQQGGLAKVAKDVYASSKAEDVILRNVKTQEVLQTFPGEEFEVTCLASHDHLLAVGYRDGMVKVFDTENGKNKEALVVQVQLFFSTYTLWRLFIYLEVLIFTLLYFHCIIRVNTTAEF